MDIADLKPVSDTLTIEFKDPRDKTKPFMNDDNTPMTWEVYAPHSKEYKKAIYKQADKRIKDKTVDMSAEDYEESHMNFLVDISKSWDITFGGTKPKFSKKLAKEVLEVFWVKDQVEEGINSYEVFPKG